MILGPEADKTVQVGWRVQNGDLGDNQPLWWICLEYYKVFGR